MGEIIAKIKRRTLSGLDSSFPGRLEREGRERQSKNLLKLSIIIFLVLLVVTGYFAFKFYSGNYFKNIDNLLLDNLEQELEFKAKIIDKTLIDSGNSVLFLSQVPYIQGIRERDTHSH